MSEMSQFCVSVTLMPFSTCHKLNSQGHVIIYYRGQGGTGITETLGFSKFAKWSSQIISPLHCKHFWLIKVNGMLINVDHSS